MSRPTTATGINGPIQIFVSYSPADERWASWIAWQLEVAGYRTMLQAWDFVPGTNFIDFMDRGLSQASAVIAVLSRHYLNSTYGRLEWQTALRADPANPPGRLITVRVEDCPLDGLLATITYIDLVGLTSPAAARDLLLDRLGHALSGRAKHAEVSYPGAGKTITGEVVPPAAMPGGESPEPPGPGLGTPAARSADAGPQIVLPRTRRAPVTAPQYPPRLPSVGAARSEVTLLHVAGPRFGRGLAAAGDTFSAADLQARIWADVTRLASAGVPKPELMVVSGDLTESGGLRECDEALAFLSGLRALLGLEPHRVMIVPGTRDITKAACRAYFATCEADDMEPQPPFWPKWRHFAAMFTEFYRGLDGPVFEGAQPWTLFPVPDLRVVVAGLNSSLAGSHRPDDDYGWLGEAQAAWFAEQLRPFEQQGWLRLGVMRHVPAMDGAGREPALLRDTETLENLLGQRLGLLLHGPGPGGGRGEELPSGLLAMPAPAAGRHQVLRLHQDGMDCWDGQREASAGPTRIARHWRAAGTFSPGGPAGLAEPDAGPALAEPDRPHGPSDMLLDRIAEVCEARYEHAKIRRFAGDLPHLLITAQDDGFIRQWRVAAHVGQPSREVLTAFLRLVHAGQPEPGSEVVYDGAQPPHVLREEAQRRGVRLRSFIEFQGLLDLRDYVAAQTARLGTDPLYPPALYVPQRFRELDRSATDVRDDLASELVRQMGADHGRFVLLLGDFGRGKTFALHELARRIPAELPHLIPLLIELRALDKAHSVEGLVAAHLANHGEDFIDLKAFRYMLREGRIVLLFDGFDELVTRITYERAADHLDTLVHAAEGKAKIVVASRTQHFESHEQVLTALGERVGVLPSRRVFTVEDFTPDQIRAYLVGRYGGDERAAGARLHLLRGVQDMLGLSRNPRMLSFIADLDDSRLAAVAGTQNTVSAAALYQEILHTWLGFEERRTQGQPGAPAGLKAADLWQAVTTLAMRLWEAGEPFLRLAELTEAGDMLARMAEGQLSPAQHAHAVGTGSLLVRTEVGTFGFIHASVAEWLVAAQIGRQLSSGVANPAPLTARPLSQLTVDFLCDLAGSQACREWAVRTLAQPGSGEVARGNAIKITTRLRTPLHSDLRGVLLQGEDLSHRELAGVDLSGADLSGALLVGTDLSEAILRDAKLTGARLDEARLTGADLRGADLSRARIAHADLRGVQVTGSSWTRAALVAVTADPALASTPELRRAAITPGQPVTVEVAPAAIGVPYGFHPQVSRLPEPVAYSADGGLLAVGSEDGGVLICDPITGQPVRTLQGHLGRVYAVKFAPGDTMLATGSSDGTIRLWDPATGECLRTLTGHRDGVWPMIMAPAGGVLAAGDADGVLRIWDLGAAQVRHALPGHTPPVYTAAFSPDGMLLAVGDAEALRLYHTETGTLVRQLSTEHGPVFRAAFSPDGSLLATGHGDGTIQLRDPATGRRRHELASESGAIYTLAFSPAGTRLASGDTSGRVRLWDPATGLAAAPLAGHSASVYWVTFSPGGGLLASCDSDGNVRLWDAATGQDRHHLSGHKASVWPMVFRPDGVQLATSGNDGSVRLWDPATGQCRHVLRGHGRRITGVRFSPSGDLLATSGNDGVVRLWQPRTGRRVRELAGTADRLISVVFSPVGHRLATASNDGGIYFWNTLTGAYERQMDVETDHLWAEAFSPSGDVIATANDDDTVKLWYTTTGRCVRTFADHRGRVRAIAFSPDGKLVATGCDDQAARLWDVEREQCVAVLAEHTDRVYSVAFSPSGSVLATASNDGTARIWDVASGTSIHTLADGRGRLWSAAFSPDGSALATAGDDLAVRLWDIQTGRQLYTLTGHSRRIWSVAFSPDGTLLASGGDDGSVGLWDLRGDGPPRLLMSLLGMPEGWAALAPDGRYKQQGDIAGQFWYAVGMCRFSPGELDGYLSSVRRLALDAEF